MKGVAALLSKQRFGVRERHSAIFRAGYVALLIGMPRTQPFTHPVRHFQKLRRFTDIK